MSVHDQARRAKRAAALAPSLYDAHTALALAYRETGQADLWRREAQNAIALNPRLAEAYELLGDWYVAASGFGCSHSVDPPLAEKYFRTALRIDPRFGVAWANLIYHLHNAGKAEEAVRVGDEGLRTLPDSIGVRRARATALLFADRPAEAEQEIRRFPERNRSLLDRWVLATVVLLRGDAARLGRASLDDSRVLGFGGSSSRMIRRISSSAALRNRSRSNGVVPVSSS